MCIDSMPATHKVLECIAFDVSSLDVVESKNAFEAQACAVKMELRFDPHKASPDGSDIWYSHPVGAIRATITTKAIAELHRTGDCYALMTMRIRGEQGIAAIFESI